MGNCLQPIFISSLHDAAWKYRKRRSQVTYSVYTNLHPPEMEISPPKKMATHAVLSPYSIHMSMYSCMFIAGHHQSGNSAGGRYNNNNNNKNNNSLLNKV